MAGDRLPERLAAADRDVEDPGADDENKELDEPSFLPAGVGLDSIIQLNLSLLLTRGADPPSFNVSERRSSML